jgi:hypothetical protein
MYGLSYTMGTTCAVLFLSGCILAQMLGVPITFSSLLDSSDMLSESACEDFSLPSAAPEPGISGPPFLDLEFQSASDLPILLTLVFHPPQSQLALS